MKFTGQGATEYLVVLAVVLIVSLVSISLLGFYPGTSKGASESVSNIYWQGQARPLKVIEASLLGDSNFTLVMENVDADPVALTGVSLVGSTAYFRENGAYSPNSTVIFGPGERKLIGAYLAGGGFDCAQGQVAKAALVLHYTTQFGAEKTERGVDISVRCSVDSGSYAPICSQAGEMCDSQQCCSGLECGWRGQIGANYYCNSPGLDPCNDACGRDLVCCCTGVRAACVEGTCVNPCEPAG